MIRLKEILEKKGLSQKWLASESGYSVVSINNWCQRKNEPSLKTLALLAKILKVKIADLIIEENLKK